MKNKIKKIFLLLIAIVVLVTFYLKLSTGQKVIKDSNIDVKPYSNQIIKDFKKVSKNNAHPRLMLNSDDFERISKGIKSDEKMQKWFNNLKMQTDNILSEPAESYFKSDGLRLLSVSQSILDRTIKLSLMYRITKEEKYAERAWMELETISNDEKFPSWNPNHFLDTAEMTNAAAIGYDWLHDYLNEHQRNLLSSAIINKGLNPAMQVFEGRVNNQELPVFWRDVNHNWNTISNAGIGMGALAVIGESKESDIIAGKVLQYAIESIKNSLQAYSPDGGFPEGPHYWKYATSYIAYFLSSLDTALGTDYQLSEIEGISEIGYYPIYTQGSETAFNIGDSEDENIVNSPQMFWFSNKFQNLDYYNAAIESNDVLSLIWYKKKNQKNLKKLPLDKIFINSNTGIVTMRNKWKEDETFLGIHAGSNLMGHGDLDIGDFVLDAQGVRWAEGLGADNYNLDGYFDSNLKRWMYYRKRAEGQNTLVINPSDAPDQNIKAKSTFTAYNTTQKQAFTIIDMTSAYYNDALSAKRGIGISKNNNLIVLRDEIKLKQPGEVYWFMHTKAEISISADGKTAILSSEGKHIKVFIESPINGEFTVMDAKPLLTSPNPSGQAVNDDLKKLAIHLNGVTNEEISIQFKVGTGEVDDFWPTSLSLNKWEENEKLFNNY